MNTDHACRTAAAAAFIIPLAIVAGARFVGGAAQHSLASIDERPPALPVIGTDPDNNPDPSRHLGPGHLASPFWNGSAAREYSPQPEPTSPQPEQGPEIRETIRLTAVMPSARNPLAVINGRPRRIGDEVVPGWTLVAIDGRERTVTVESGLARRIVIDLSR